MSFFAPEYPERPRSSNHNQFRGRGQRPQPKPRPQIFTKTKDEVFISQTDVERLKQRTLDSQRSLSKPVSLWRRERNGRISFVKSYATDRLAEASIDKVPARVGELVILSEVKPTDDYIEKHKNNHLIVRFVLN